MASLDDDRIDRADFWRPEDDDANGELDDVCHMTTSIVYTDRIAFTYRTLVFPLQNLL